MSDRINYVKDALDYARETTGLALKKPWLVPLSDGGPMAFQLACKSPRKYSGLLGISTHAKKASGWKSLGPNFPIRLLHGDRDARITSGSAHETVDNITDAGGDAELTVIKGANHFLVLSHPKAVREFLVENI